MSITKSIILTALLYLITSSLDFVILSLNVSFPVYQHLVGLSEILSYLIGSGLLIFYLRITKLDVSFPKDSITTNTHTLISALVILAIGDHLVDLPFFHWKDLANAYFGTKWQIPDYSNYHLSTFQCYRAVSALVFAPILEEIFFRYYIFGGLLKRYKFSTALLTSSILFALVHIDSASSLRNVAPAFIFGAISCLVYFTTKKIINSIILHFFANAIWFITVVYSKGYSELTKQIGYGVMFWILFLAGILLLWIGIKKVTTANMRLAAMASARPRGVLK